jgi:hypothetical protein
MTAQEEKMTEHRTMVEAADDEIREPRARTAVMDARAALSGIGDQLPEMARTSRELVGEAMRAIEQGTDTGLSTSATLSLGLAVGLLIGGAPRLLVLTALIPAAAIGIQMIDRQRVSTTKTRSTTG